jgi:uncharacterized protein (DUF983 family)
MTVVANREPYVGPLVSRSQARSEGLTRYFTGKVCPRGHICQRKVFGCTCTYCDFDLNIRYLADNPEVMVAFRERQAAGLVIPMAIRREGSGIAPAERGRRREARKTLSGEHYTAEDMNKIFRRQRKRCAICGEKVAEADRSDDHIVSLLMGGSDAVSNMQVVHIRCNQSKGGRHPIEHMQRITRGLAQPKFL